MSIWLYPIIGFCTTAVAIGLCRVLERSLKRQSNFYRGEKNDG